MEKSKKKIPRAVFNVSSPPTFAQFVKPASARPKPKKYNYALSNPALSANPLYKNAADSATSIYIDLLKKKEPSTEKRMEKISRATFNVSSLPTFAQFVKPVSARSKLKKILKPYLVFPKIVLSPAISIIIPMYNVEEYVGECLDSLLLQTFQDFEVIVVDDCSTDNSVKIVENYIPKFEGRLKLAQMKENSGCASKPRNYGLKLARGEYIFFLDSDDFIMLNTLETLYTAAKKYDTDVICSSAYYRLKQPNDIYLYRDGEGKKLIREGLEDKFTLIVNNPDKNFQQLLLEEPEGNFRMACMKLVRRDFLLKNEILFFTITQGEDFLWVINVYCHAKRFLRFPVPLYFYRKYNINSITETNRTPPEHISHWVTEFSKWMRFLSDLANKNEILSKNPAYCLAALKHQFEWTFYKTHEAREKISDEEIYKILFSEFIKGNYSFKFTLPFFFSLIGAYERNYKDELKILERFTARIDIKFMSNVGTGDFQILFLSDNNAKIYEPLWLQKDGIGYQIQSSSGGIEVVFRVTADGQIKLDLRGLDVRDKQDPTKRIPCWIDYTKLTLNGRKVFNKLTPAWHDEPYRYTTNVKAGDEIKLQVEWLPHKGEFNNFSTKYKLQKIKESLVPPLPLPSEIDNFPAISIIIPVYNAEKYIGEALDSIRTQTFQNFEVIVVDDCSKDSSYAVVESYIPKFNGHLKLLQMDKNSGSAPAPRNKGLPIARGEYVFFMDSDDTFTQTALEEMYNLAKEYDADVVYCEKYYMSTGVGEEYIENIHLADNRMQKPPFVEKPTFAPDNLADRLEELFKGKFWVTPWQRLVSRKLLMEKNINFPVIIGSDDVVWCFQVLCCAKKFLRVPNICYVRRMYDESFTQSSKKSPNRHIHQWMDITVRGLKFVNNFMDQLEFFHENPAYRYKALNMFANLPLSVIAPVCEKLTPEEIYNIFLTEFSKDTGENNVVVSLLFTQLMNQRKELAIKDPVKEAQKLLTEKVATINNFADNIYSIPDLPALSSASPSISVVIPLYNAEEYIGECLTSLLMQTFQDFEVIVVDDVSTDDSVAIVNRYVKNFSGRLKLASTKENSGGGGYVPRNIGLELANGEYIFFLDADDIIVDNTLETLYRAAKDYEADVVYTSAHYRLEQNKISKELDGIGNELTKKGLEDKSTLIIDDPDKNVQQLLFNNDFHMPYTKFVRRDFLLENEITFPKIISGGDFIWTIHVYCCSKRFLRLPIPLYFYRKNPDSVTEQKQEPSKQIVRCVKAFILGVKALHDLSSRMDLLKYNLDYFRAACTPFFKNCLKRCFDARMQFNTQDLYDVLHQEFAANPNDSAIPFLFSFIDAQQKVSEEDTALFLKLNAYLTARADIQLVPKTGKGDFQVLSVSDDRANVLKPAWLQKGGIGYTIQSYAGKMEFVTQATADGKINLYLRGLDVKDPKDKSKRVPYWIDYTKLTINGKTIIDKLTPAWHDKAYHHTMDVKAGEELKVQMEWLPHRGDVLPDKPKEKPLVDKFLPYVTGRMDIQLVPKIGKGDFKILSLSDDKANVQKPAWLQKNGVGYQIHSYVGKIEFVAKATADGKINLDLRGLDVKDSKDKTKRIPYWIDYTKLTINGKTIIDKLTPAWHDKAYRYTMDVKAGEELKVQMEWLPHRGDILPDKPKEKPLVDKFLPYVTGRMDIQLVPKAGKGDFKILSLSDDKANVQKPAWLQKNGVGYQIHSYVGKMEFVAKATADGKINLDLRGLDVKDSKDKTKRIPYWIDYTKLTINGKTIIDKLTPTWHDKAYHHTMDVKAGEELKIQTEWLPHRGDVLSDKPKEKPLADKFLPYVTGRMDIQLVPKTGKGDFKILSISDDKANVQKPAWLQKNGVGYTIQSYVGKMDIVAKATAEGKIRLNLLGMDIRDSKDKSKRVPYWIDYTKLTINGKTIFNKRISVWHDKLYRHDMDVKAGAELKIQVEWFPHRADVLPDVPKPAEKAKSVVEEFLPNLTARLDVQMISKTGKGDFKILSLSDNRATTAKPGYLNKNGIGYVIQSYTGKMNFVARATADGQVTLKLKGMDVRDPKDNSKRVPYWIDYTNLIVNGKTILDKLTPAWHDKLYRHDMDVKANEEIVVQVEWLPHKEVVKESKPVEKLKLVADKVSDVAQEIKPAEKLEPVADKVSDDVEKTKLTEKIELVIDKVSNVVEEPKTVEKLEPVADKVSDDVQETKPAEKLEPVADKVSDVVQEIKPAEKLESVVDKVSDVVEEPKPAEKLEPVADKVSDAAQETKTVEKLEPVADKVSNAAQETKPEEKLEPVADKVLDAAQETKPVEKLEPVADKVSDAAQETKPAEKLESVVDKVSDVVEEPKPAEKLEPVADKVSDAAQETKPEEKFEPVADKVSDATQEPTPVEKLEPVADKVSDSSQEPTPAEKLEPVADKVSDATQEPTPAEKLEPVADKVSDAAQEPTPAEKLEPVADKVSDATQEPTPAEKAKPVVEEFSPNLTARLDVQMVPKTGKGDFKILSVSDDKATVAKPAWLQKDGIGYIIQSYAGTMKFIAKATTDGQLSLKLKGMDIRDSNDKSKRVPYWIDYTKLTVNGETIIDKLTPAWHDKLYRHNMDVKADEEVIVQVEWIPHKEVVEETKPAEKVKPVADKFPPNLTGRLDLKLVPKTDKGDLKILSVSDDKATVAKPDWFQKDGVGYIIQSQSGNMNFIAQATAEGQLTLKLKGMDVPDPKDKSKRIPYWIDYTRLMVNGKTIFDELIPAWHDKPHRYDIDLKADDVIIVQIEWLPHNNDT